MSEEFTIEQEIAEKLKEKGITNEEKKEETTVSETKEPTEEVLEEPTTKSEEQSTSEDPVASLASKFGWDEKGPKSAEEYIAFAMENLEPRGKELKQLKFKIDELTSHLSNLKKAGYKDKMEALKAERDEAVVRSDVDSVNYIDDELYKVKTELSQEETEPQVHPVALDFVNKYKDILQDYSLESQEIKEFINERDIQLASYNLDPEVHIKTLEKDMKSKFPDKFNVQSKEPEITAVESDSRPITTTKKSKYTFADLNNEQKSMYKYLEKRGVMSGNEYIKQLVDTEALK